MIASEASKGNPLAILAQATSPAKLAEMSNVKTMDKAFNEVMSDSNLSERMNTPMLRLPEPFGDSRSAGVVTGLEHVAEGVATPTNIALLASLGGAPAVIQKLASAYFMTTMGKGAIEQGIAASQATNPKDRFQLGTEAVASAVLAGLAGTHALGREAMTPEQRLQRREAALPSREASPAPSEAPQAEAPPSATPATPALPTAQTQDISGQAHPENIISGLNDKINSLLQERRLSNDELHRSALWNQAMTLEHQLSAEEAKAKAPEPSTPEAAMTEVASAEPPTAPQISPETTTVDQPGQSTVDTPPEPPISVGPGAANAAEFPDQRTTGLKKATVKDERLARGLEDLPPRERQAIEPRVQRAEDATDADPSIAPKLVARILEGDHVISEDDAAVLLVERNRLLNERTTVQATFDNPESSVADKAVAQEHLNEIEKKNEELDRAQRAAGSSTGGTLRMYREMIKDDFSLDQLLFKKRKSEGRALTQDEISTIEAQTEKIKEQQKEVDRLHDIERQATEAADIARVHASTIKDLQNDIAGRPKFGKEVFEIAHKIVNKWKAEADTARLDLRSRLGRTSAGVDPTILIDVAKIIRAKIGEFGLSQAESFSSLLEEFGEDVRPYLSKAWAKAQSLINAEKAPPKAKAAVKEGIKKKGEKTPVDIRARAKAEATAGEKLSHKTVYDLVRSMLNEGIAESDVLKAAHDELKQHFPDISQRDVNRAYVDYGKKIHPSKEELAVKMRHLHQATKIQEDIDRLEKDKLRPESQGYQRDKADQKIRDLIKKRNDLLKQHLGPPEPGKLASRDEAKQTALKNAIEDLDRELQTGIKKDRSAGVPDSPTTERLRAELGAMREKKAEIEAAENPGKSEAEKQMDSLSKIKQRLDDTLSGVSTPKTPKEFEALSQSAEDMKAEILAMQELAAQMRRDAKPTVDKHAADLKRLNDRLDDAKDRLARMDIFGTKKSPAVDPPDIAAVRAEIKGIQDTITELLRKPSDPNATQIKALEKQIDEYSRKVREADFSTKGTQQGPPNSKRVVELRSILESRRSMYELAKKLNRTVLTPEQRYNATRQKVVAKQLVDIRAKIAAGKFERPAKRVSQSKSTDTMKAEAELQSEKNKFTKGLLQAEHANKPNWQKTLEYTAGVARASALSGYHTLIKLAGYDFAAAVTTPITEAAGSVLSRTPGLRGVFKASSMESGGTVKVVAKFYTAMATKGMKEAWQVLRGGTSETKLRHGKQEYLNPKWYDFFGRLHLAEKTPLLTGTYEMYLERGNDHAIREGLNPDDEFVKAAIQKAAYDHSQAAILQENNKFAEMVNQAQARMEQANPKTGKIDITNHVISTLVRTLLTKGIIRTPANYIAQTIARTPIGLATGLFKAARANYDGIGNLKPAEANAVSRLLKVGAVGSAFFVLGAIDATKKEEDRWFGGYWAPGRKRDGKDVNWGKIRVMGHQLPHLVTHNPFTESAQMGSTMIRIALYKLHKKDQDPQGITAGAIKAVIALGSKAPVVSPIMRAGESYGDPAADMLSGLIPQLLQNIAEDIDPEERAPKGTIEKLESGIPWVRETLPAKSEHKKRHVNERIPIHAR